jgi:hypothetical protein
VRHCRLCDPARCRRGPFGREGSGFTGFWSGGGLQAWFALCLERVEMPPNHTTRLPPSATRIGRAAERVANGTWEL